MLLLDLGDILLCCSKYFTSCGVIKFIIQIAATIPAADVRFGAFFGEDTGRILLDDVICNGSESRLIDCGHCLLGQHNCQHSMDAGVICSGKHSWQIGIHAK